MDIDGWSVNHTVIFTHIDETGTPKTSGTWPLILFTWEHVVDSADSMEFLLVILRDKPAINHPRMLCKHDNQFSTCDIQKINKWWDEIHKTWLKKHMSLLLYQLLKVLGEIINNSATNIAVNIAVKIIGHLLMMKICVCMCIYIYMYIYICMCIYIYVLHSGYLT